MHICIMFAGMKIYLAHWRPLSLSLWVFLFGLLWLWGLTPTVEFFTFGQTYMYIDAHIVIFPLDNFLFDSRY